MGLLKEMDWCVAAGNFLVKEWLVRFMYTGESNLIPFILTTICSYLRNQEVDVMAKLEMLDFLNEIFVIGDVQITEEFNKNVIPVMLELIHPLDFKTFTITQNQNNHDDRLVRKYSECLSFWGELNSSASELLAVYINKTPLGRGNALLKSRSIFSQAL